MSVNSNELSPVRSNFRFRHRKTSKFHCTVHIPHASYRRQGLETVNQTSQGSVSSTPLQPTSTSSSPWIVPPCSSIVYNLVFFRGLFELVCCNFLISIYMFVVKRKTSLATTCLACPPPCIFRSETHLLRYTTWKTVVVQLQIRWVKKRWSENWKSVEVFSWKKRGGDAMRE